MADLIKIPELQATQAIVDKDGRPLSYFQRYINSAFKQLRNFANAIIDAQNAADAANAAAAAADAAASAAQGAADSTMAETSIVNSFVKDFTGASAIEADNVGNVTIKNHTRQYGDPTLNPDVSITGSVVATGEVSPSIVRVYYIDPTRADTTPTFLFTVDPADAPVQGGDRHVIGAVEIPAAGTSDGGTVRPPGYTGTAQF